MSARQHACLPPGRSEQPTPPHVPHVELQQTAAEPLKAAETSVLRPRMPALHSSVAGGCGMTHPVSAADLQVRPLLRMAGGQHAKPFKASAQWRL
eukprot:2587857-Prymnesium_polylepis.1